MRDSGEDLLASHLAGFLVGLSELNTTDHRQFAALVKDLVTAVDDGHSCLQVSAKDKDLLAGTRLVSDRKGIAPLILVGDRLYFHRYYNYEARLAAQVGELAKKDFVAEKYHHYLDRAFSHTEDEIDYQKRAAELAVKKALCIISGGPGTGKTSTVARILGILLQIFGSDCRIALAGPTGKAAMRLRQSVISSIESSSFPEEIKRIIPDQAATIHRLLGVKRFSAQFYHNRENPMNWDVVVVDEASMVDLALMSNLVDALKPGGRLILLGDKDQLVSVESGAVLANLIESLPENTVILKKSYRFNETIKSLAEAVNTNDSIRSWSLLDKPDGDATILKESLEGQVCRGYSSYMEYVKELKRKDYNDVFQVFNTFRVLCGLRLGRFGIEGINRLVERVVRAGQDQHNQWYTGRPVMILRNDYGLDLYNGDIGICLPDPDDQDRLKVWFEVGDGEVKPFLPFRLPRCETVYAMTIHKSQGSEFDEVLIVLPEEDNQLLSRELIYTAITRARKKITISCNRTVWNLALSRKTKRSSGLVAMLSD